MFRSLLVPLDGSSFAEHAVPVATEVARRAGASLWLVTVGVSDWYGLPPGWPNPAAELERAQTAYLDDVRRRLAPIQQVRTAVLADPVAPALCEFADTHDVDLVVMTTHGRTGLSRLWLGSTADAVVRSIGAPVLLWRARDRETGAAPAADALSFAHLLVALDGSDEAERILHAAMSIASIARCAITLVQVVAPVLVPVYPYPHGELALPGEAEALGQRVDHATAYLNGVATRLRAGGVAPVDIDVRVDERTAHAILDAAGDHHADLIALTTHGRGMSRLALGSVADKIVRGSPGPVLVMRRAQPPNAHP